jgi:uncharacterized protein YueI
VNKTAKLTLIILFILVVAGSAYRIFKLNHDRDYYIVHYEEVKDGDEISVSNLNFHFGKTGQPILENSDIFEGKKKVIYELPVTIENHNEKPLNMLEESPVRFFENYKGFYNAVPIFVDKAKDTQETINVLSNLPVQKPVTIILKTDLAAFSEYSDYSVDKEARLVLMTDPSPEGIKAYYYRLKAKE